MRFKALHSGFKLPTKGSDAAGGYDIYMPEDGYTSEHGANMVPLGFAAEVPAGYVALLLPRSSTGAKFGLELNNTVGVIDADYRGEWKACLRTKDNTQLFWGKHERMLQFLLVPVANVEPTLTEELSDTNRSTGGFGSTGN